MTRYESAKNPGLTMVWVIPSVIEKSRSASQHWRVMSRGGRTCQPLRHSDNVLEAGLPRGYRKSHYHLNHVGVVRRAKYACTFFKASEMRSTSQRSATTTSTPCRLKSSLRPSSRITNARTNIAIHQFKITAPPVCRWRQ